jgi:hypothetical protein
VKPQARKSDKIVKSAYNSLGAKTIRRCRNMTDNNLLFDVLTPLNCTICVSVAYWEIITQIKHPVMKGQEKLVQETLSQSD